MKEIKIEVEGMECTGCEQRIIRALEKIEGVTKVSADYQTGIVRIQGKEDVEANTLDQEIEDLGFTVIEEK